MIFGPKRGHILFIFETFFKEILRELPWNQYFFCDLCAENFSSADKALHISGVVLNISNDFHYYCCLPPLDTLS